MHLLEASFLPVRGMWKPGIQEGRGVSLPVPEAGTVAHLCVCGSAFGVSKPNLDKGFSLQLSHSCRAECMGWGIWKGLGSEFCLPCSLISSAGPLKAVWGFPQPAVTASTQDMAVVGTVSSLPQGDCLVSHHIASHQFPVIGYNNTAPV